MTARKLTAAALAAALLAAPFAGAASAATTPVKPHPHKPMVHRMGKPMRSAPRDAGSSATDALNDQSLARARGGQ